MAQTFKARAGSSLRARFDYRQPDGELVDTTGSTARVSIRAVKPATRVILVAEASETEGATLELLEPGSWQLYLSGTITKILPPIVAWEVEIISDTDPDDIYTLEIGTILTEPELVKNLDS